MNTNLRRPIIHLAAPRLLPAALFFILCSLRPGFTEVPATGDGGIIYGTDHAFMVSAPRGWVLDNKSGVSQGLHAVFYPEGSNWKDSDAVMYVNTVSKSDYPEIKLDSFIQGDIKKSREKNPELQVSTQKALHTRDRKKAHVRSFAGDRWGNHEAVAYIEEETVFVIIALTCREEESYRRSFSAFKNLVSSYLFVTDDVHIEN